MKNNQMLSLLGLLVILLLIWVIVVGVTDDSGDTKVVLIVTKDQVDTASLNPTRMQVASQMALEDFNNKTAESKSKSREIKIENHYITYIGSEEEGYKLAKQFLDANSNVIAIVGDFNSAGTVLMTELAEEYRIPHLSFFATEETIVVDKPWSYSYRSTLKQERDVMLDILLNYIDAKRVAVVGSDVRNLLQRWTDLQPDIEAKGVTIHSAELFSNDTQDFRQYIDWLKEEEDQFDTIVVFLSAKQIEHFLQQLSIKGINKPILITSVTMSVEGIAELQGIDMPMYSFVPAVFLKIGANQDTEFQSLVDRYRVAIGYHRFDSIGPWIYDGLGLLYELIDTDSSAEEIRQQLSAYNQERMIGPVSFDKNGILEDGTFRIVQIQEGQFIEVNQQ